MKKTTLLIAVFLLTFFSYAKQSGNAMGIDSDGLERNPVNWSSKSYEPTLKLQRFLQGDLHTNLWNVLLEGSSLLLLDDLVCTPPSALNFDALSYNTARINWTGSTTVGAKYDVYYSTVATVPTAATAGQVVNLNAVTTTLNALNSNTTYFVWVRSSCVVTTGPTTETVKGAWLGSMSFTTLASLPYSEGFESTNHGWEFGTGTHVNKWVVDTAVKSTGLKSLYISKDNGVTHTYNISGAQVTHAAKKMVIPTGTQQVMVSFDWMCKGDGFPPFGALDYFRAWVVPEAFVPATGTQITTASGGILLRANAFNNSNTFLRENLEANLAAFAGQNVKLVFEWRNDATDGNQPPAAIDNIQIKQVVCAAPVSLNTTELTQNSVKVNWRATGVAAQGYDIYYTNNQNPIIYDDQVATLTGITNLSQTLTGLLPDTDYYIWVRSNCGVPGKSIWSGPVSVRTGQIPAPLVYEEGFEATSGWGFVNDAVNKWVVGSAVHHGGANSLYISNNNGADHQYEVVGAQISHAYRDFVVTPDMQYLNIAFDWKAKGEGYTTTTKKDYFRVWLVPIDFLPSKGVTITEWESNGIRIGKEFYNNNDTFSREVLEVSLGGIGNTSNKRIIFEWINDSRNGNQPPAAIDNVEIKKLTCFAPTLLTGSNVTNTAVDLAWTQPVSLPTDYEVFYQETPDYPSSNAVANQSAINGNRYTLSGLTQNTEYYIWVRSNCGLDSKSHWVGPLKIKTLSDPALLPYVEDFEGVVRWEMASNQENKWFVGEAVNNGGTHSMYISNRTGESNLYTTSVASVSHTWRDIQFTNKSEVNISFDWRSVGENNADYFRVWLVPTTYIPVPGTAITQANSGGVPLGLNSYSLSNTFLTETFDADVHRYVNKIGRLVFEWVNNNSGGQQLPAAIDNIRVENLACAKPYDLKAFRVHGTNKVILDWEPGGDETQWEVIIQPQGGPAPGAGFLVEGDSKFLTEEWEEGDLFEYYVKAICDGGVNSKWVGPMRFSIFNPPVCADVLVEDDITADLNENARFVLCEGDETKFKLKASYYKSQKTDSYKVEQIDYDPPFPFLGGEELGVNVDDDWGRVVDLPFDVCFFGNNYNKVQVGANGLVTFNATYRVAAGGCIYSGLVPIPSTLMPHPNSIYGVYQDIDPSIRNQWAKPSINFQVLGTYPCRAFVVNFSEVANWSCGSNADVGPQTSQIVIYEISNIVEVYIKDRKPCLGAWNGNGVVGMLNATGTLASVPPGRNTGAWSAHDEAWRFTPDGGNNSSFEWLKDGIFFSDNAEIEIDVDKSVIYKAVGVYEKCNGEAYRVEQTFDFLKDEDIDVDLAQTMLQCFNYKGEYVYNLKDNETNLLRNLNLSKYNLTYHNTKEEALDGLPTILEDSITVKSPTLIYVRVEQKSTKCFKIVALNLNIEKRVQMTPLQDIQACMKYELPPLNEYEEYYSETNKGGQRYYPGDIISKIGTNKIFVFGQQGDCIDEKSFFVTITELINAEVLPDVLLKCENFVLPELPIGNRYFTESHLDGGDGGEELPAGSIVRFSQTIYVYAKSFEGPDFCIDESSFKIKIQSCDLPKGISPNGDGINDFLNLDAYGVTHLVIFNRYGKEVYEFKGNYTKEWMGQDKSGNALPDGTYYYTVITHGETKTGWIQINK